MSARLLAVGLACAAILAGVPLLPPTPVLAAEAATRSRTLVDEAVADIDWAAYTRGHVAAFGVDDEAQQRGRDALRAELALDGAGGNGTSSTPGAVTGLEAQRLGALGNRWYDTCGEPRVGRVDLRGTIIAQSVDSAGRQDQTGFLAYGCTPWTASDLGAGGITWGLYSCYEGAPAAQDPQTGCQDSTAPTSAAESSTATVAFPDFLVSIFPDGDQLKITAVRTPEADRSTWYMTWLADAKRLDDFEVDGVVPTKAIGDLRAAEFGFYLSVIDASSATDVFPEPYMADLPAYPRSCDGGLEPAQLAAAQMSPNDPQFANQWGLPTVKAPTAWARRSSADVLVAIVDDGVDGRRTDFDGRVVAGYDSVYDQSLVAGTDSNRGNHGTAVAAVLAAAGNNGSEIAGVNWGARILPIRVVDTNGCISAEAVARAIDHARYRGAKIINISLGGPDDEAVRAAVDRAEAAGITVVAASGNSGDASAPFYPATLPAVIAVGATDRAGAVAHYSGTGRHLDLVAPGGDASGRPTGDIVVPWDLGTTAAVAGTSYAAPLVAGAASLYLGEHPHATNGDVRLALERSAVDMGTAGHDTRAGHGLLDVAAMLEVPAGGGPLPDPATGELARIDERIAIYLPIEISRQRFPDPGTKPADYVVLSRDDVFSDSLVGASLSKDGPLLVTSPAGLAQPTADEIARVLGPRGSGRGPVYLLGGTAALGEDIATELVQRGFEVRRLAGPSRVETSVAVAQEVQRRTGADQLAIARAYGTGDDPTSAWADSVTGGAWAAAAGVPVVVTGSTLHPAVARYLEQHPVRRTVLLGGSAALPAAIEAAVPSPQRAAGADRAATAAAVATELWERSAGYVVTNGYEPTGWLAGLAGAGLAADRGTPLLLVDRSRVPDVTAQLTAGTCAAGVTLIGDASRIGGSVEAQLAAVTSC